MNTDPTSATFRRQCILMAFLLKKSVYDTKKFLEDELTGLTFQEVRAWFNRFITGNFDIVTDIDMVPDIVMIPDQRKEDEDDGLNNGLNKFPPEIKRKILESTSYSGQRSMLALNQSFRNIIKEDKRLYREIKLSFGMDRLCLAVTTPFKQVEYFLYTKKENGCELNNDGKISVFSTSYIEEGMRKFNETIEKKGTKIKKLDITSRKPETADQDYFKFYSKSNEIFNKLENKLHVENLTFEASKKEDFQTVLKSLDAYVLQTIMLRNDTGKTVLDSCVTSTLLLRLTSLRQLLLWDVNWNVSPDSYAVIPCFNADVETMTSEDIRKYRDKLNHTSRFSSHAFYGNIAADEVMRGFAPLETNQFSNYDGIFVTAPHGRIGFKVVAGFKLELYKIYK